MKLYVDADISYIDFNLKSNLTRSDKYVVFLIFIFILIEYGVIRKNLAIMAIWSHIFFQYTYLGLVHLWKTSTQYTTSITMPTQTVAD